jgi:hypothetical protein
MIIIILKTKFSTYASFHVLVNEDDFPLINNTGVWPNGCLITPFFGKLTPEQIYSPSTPVKTAQVGALSAAAMSPAPRIPTDHGSGQL